MERSTSPALDPTDPRRPAVPFNDLSVQWRLIADDVRSDIEKIFASSAFCLGPYVESLEQEIAAMIGAPHAIGVNSGTSALHLATLAAGIGPGDEVLVPSHTFIATIWGVLYAGAHPVLCDVDADTATIDVHDAERRLTSRTKAIIPVHLYGQPAQMDDIMTFAIRQGLTVIEDAAQSFGARWNGRATGAIGHFGCFSFYPGKNLGGAGESGLIVTSDDAAAARLRSLRNHGQTQRYLHTEIGYNYRMDGLQGMVLSHKLRHIEAWTTERKRLARRYQANLAGLPIDVPQVRNQDHVWHLFVIRTARRDALQQHLTARRIECGLHYPMPNHRQPSLCYLASDPAAFPQTERWATQGLSLPIFFGMHNEQVDAVCDAVRDFFAHD